MFPFFTIVELRARIVSSSATSRRVVVRRQSTRIVGSQCDARSGCGGHEAFDAPSQSDRVREATDDERDRECSEDEGRHEITRRHAAMRG